ncbi:PIG-L family deacetylase, partial [bacterium]
MNLSYLKTKILSFLIFIIPSFCFAQQVIPLYEITANDRILILAPHPDDESIGTAGIIQKSLKSCAKIKVVCFTNGDNNQLAFIVYEKRLTFKKKEFLHMGEVRRAETLEAMNYLGVNRDDVVFLGYPDFGTQEILMKYWGKTKPYRSMFPRVNKVSYPEALSYGSSYVGENILSDLKKVLLGFKPTKIFVSHPGDSNRDHRALYVFLRIALWDLEGKIEAPKVFPYLIHAGGWPRPRGYHPDLELVPSEKFNTGVIKWKEYRLSDDEILKKKDAISFYHSQIDCDPPYLFTFARKNELFGDFPWLKLNVSQGQSILWQDLQDGKTNLQYGLKDKFLYIKLNYKFGKIRKPKVLVYLLGYKQNKEFALLPKITLYKGFGGLRLKDKKQTLFIKD